VRYRALVLARDGTLYAAGNRPRRVGSDAVATRLTPSRTAETVTHAFGLRAVSLVDGSSRVFAPKSVCGSRIAAGTRSVVVAQPKRVVVVGRRYGHVVRALVTRSTPLDVLLGPRP
jgi:hypothetical protein